MADLQYLLRRENGTMATVVSSSERKAVQTFIDKYKPPIGEEIAVKLRGSPEDWSFYRVSK